MGSSRANRPKAPPRAFDYGRLARWLGVIHIKIRITAEGPKIPRSTFSSLTRQYWRNEKLSGKVWVYLVPPTQVLKQNCLEVPDGNGGYRFFR